MGARRGIVVVNFGSSALLEANLRRVASDCMEDLVVVVDNFSSDEERKTVESLCRREVWEFVPLATNRGFGAGVNRGVAAAFAAGVEEVLVLNPDAHIGRTNIDLLSAALVDTPFAIASPRILDEEGKPWFSGADVYLSDGSTRGRAKRAQFPGSERWEWLSGACVLIPRSVWDAVGGFDEEFFLYWEDVDFSRRAVIAGARLLLVDDATAWHDEGGTHRDAPERSRAKSNIYYYYNIRNRMLFAVRHLDEAGVRRWSRGSWRAAREVLLRGGRRQFLTSLKPLRAAFRGVRDGRRLAGRLDLLHGLDPGPRP